MTTQRTRWPAATLASLTCVTGAVAADAETAPAAQASTAAGTAAAAPSAAAIAAPVAMTASLPAAPWAAGQPVTATVAIDLAGHAPAPGPGQPAMLQIDVPPSVTLVGRVIEGRQLARNEFLESPFERVIDLDGGSFDFRVTGEPAAEERLGITVIMYLQDADGTPRFVRRRVDLPLAGGATGTGREPAADSGWGRNGTLEIGQRAPAHVLPRADGSTLDLGELLGTRPIIVTTYRAFW